MDITGYVFLPILMIAGGFFTAFLFDLNVKVGLGGKTAEKIRNVSLAIGISGLILLGFSLYKICQVPFYEYQIRAYYIDGGTRVLSIKSAQDPYIKSFRGSYYLKCGIETEIGVVRFDVLSKQKVE